jgi:hypothetical protein
MSIPAFLEKADKVIGVRREVGRVANALGPAHAPTFLAGIDVSPRMDVKDGVGTVVGAVAGGYACRGNHPYLGVIGGASLGRNLPALLQNGLRGAAVRNLVTTGSGIGGSLYMKKNPVLGFIVGAVAGAVASHFGGFGEE